MAADGTIRRCGRDEILTQPDLLVDAGMSVPAWLRIARELSRIGVPANKVWNPKELAAETARFIESAGDRMPHASYASIHEHSSARNKEPAPMDDPTKDGNAARTAQNGRSADTAARRGAAPSPLSSFDPRSVWLTYILFSAAIFAQRSWAGIALSMLLTAAAIMAFRIPLRRWRGPITALGLFSLSVSVLSGLSADGNGVIWHTEAFLGTLRSLIRPWLAMLLGFGLPMAITPLRLRRSLIQLMSVRGRAPKWGQPLILAVTLLLRFIPVILTEWGRFSRIAIARGKDNGGAWQGASRRLRDTAIPFLLSLFRLGENAASALESRGIGSRRDPSLPEALKWQRRDSLLLAGGVIVSGFLWGWGRGLIG
jgi:energy-coupling factor transporter transmembrane protein EcfT